MSQSIFLVQTSGFGPSPDFPRLPKYDASTVGCSPPMIILSITVGGSLVAALIINAMIRRYKTVPSGFPAMGSSSAAISAVCQRPKEDKDAHLFPVRLGVVADRNSDFVGSPGQIIFSTYVDLQQPQGGLPYILPVVIQKEGLTITSLVIIIKRSLSSWTDHSITTIGRIWRDIRKKLAKRKKR